MTREPEACPVEALRCEAGRSSPVEWCSGRSFVYALSGHKSVTNAARRDKFLSYETRQTRRPPTQPESKHGETTQLERSGGQGVAGANPVSPTG